MYEGWELTGVVGSWMIFLGIEGGFVDWDIFVRERFLNSGAKILVFYQVNLCYIREIGTSVT